MNLAEARRDFVSIGQLAAHLRQPVRAIERAAVKLELAPALRLNGVAHFDGIQVELIRGHLTNDE